MLSIIKSDREYYQELIDSWSTKERDYLWASDLGKPHYDIYHKLKGTESDNPITVETIGKMKAGELYEWGFIESLKDRGLKVESQKRVEYQKEGCLKVTGKIDAIVDDTIIEVKSVNSKAFWYTEKFDNGSWYKGFYIPYYFQLLAYLRAEGQKQGILLFISRDDTTKAEIPISVKPDQINKDFDQWLGEMSRFIQDDIEPPKPPTYIEGRKYNRSTKKYEPCMEVNKQVEFSSYRERIVGMEWDDFLLESKKELNNLNNKEK